MTKEEIQELYKTRILPENKSPYHFEKRPGADMIIDAYNPMCGDKYKLYLSTKDGAISEAYFDGIGCAISRASTSILVRKLEGLSIQDAFQLAEEFCVSIEEDQTSALLDQDMQVLDALKSFNGRMDCIKLSWKAMLEQTKK